MMIRNISIFQSDYESVGDWRGPEDGANVQQNHQVIKTIIPKQFESDIQALCDYAGIKQLTPGMSINMTLQEILSVAPRVRARLDSYKALVNFLHDEMSVELTIKSRKHNGQRQV